MCQPSNAKTVTKRTREVQKVPKQLNHLALKLYREDLPARARGRREPLHANHLRRRTA